MFPPTANFDSILLGDDPERRRALAAHIAEVYSAPLARYLGSLPEVRDSGLDPDEVVNELVIKKLLKETDYLDRWRESGKRLRLWLCNGVQFELKTQLKGSRRYAQRHANVDLRDPASTDGTGLLADEEEVDARWRRDSARAMMASAMRRAEGRCPSPDHWQAMRLSSFEGRTFAEIGEALGVKASRAAVMARTARRLLRESIEAQLNEEGISSEDQKAIAGAIDELFDDLSGMNP